MDEVEELLHKLYNEKETMVLYKEETAVELSAMECELNVLIRRKKQLPVNVISYIFWCIVVTGLCSWFLLIDAGIAEIAKVGIVFVIPLYIKLWIDTIKSIAELIYNLDNPIIENLASKQKIPNINVRITELTKKIAANKVIIENYDAKALELKKQINKIIADNGF